MFYDTFESLCKNRGISVTKATQEIGLSRTIGTKWKSTSATPNGETLSKIAAYFGISVSELLGEQPNQQKKESPADLEGLDPEEDRGFFKIMASAKQDGMSEEDVQIALDFFRRARMQDELIEKEKGNK